jgi:prepilin-type N-terminal cleavage/methylation domain-containing protein
MVYQNQKWIQRFLFMSNGFSLVELIVVIAVAAIVTGILAVSIDSMNDDTRLANAAYRAQGDVRYAHEMALTHRREVNVVVNASSNQYELRWHDDGSLLPSPIDGTDMIVQFGTGIYQGVTISSSGLSGRLSFNEVGTALIGGTVFSGIQSIMLLDSKIHVTVNDAGFVDLNEVEGSGC